MTVKHKGFKSIARNIARKEHIPIANAKAILASRSRQASRKAIKCNPKLLKVRRHK